MRRSFALIGVFVTLLLAGQAAAAGLGPGKTAAVKVAACNQSADGAQRFVTFKAQMSSESRQLRMQMRFYIYESTGLSWSDVTPPEVAIWDESAPGSRTYVYRQRIDNLKPGARYRSAVKFRWLDAAGNVVAMANRRSAVCKMSALISPRAALSNSDPLTF